MRKRLPFVKRYSARILALGALALIAGCAMFSANNHREASSVMAYLYPRRADTHVDTPTIPVLSLPLRVGVAFVPEQGNRQGGNFISWENERFTEK